MITMMGFSHTVGPMLSSTMLLVHLIYFSNSAQFRNNESPGAVHIAKVYYIEGYRNYDFRFLQTMFKIKISS